MISPVELRHRIHQNPELAMQEFETTKLIIESIKDAAKINNVEIIIHRPLKTGLIVEYKQNNDNFTMLRADIDALPTIEQTGCDFSSINDNMHACGHDIHVAALYGFILHVFSKKPNQNYLFLFQPAEEAIGGAKMILETGFLDNYKINKSYAFHVNDDFEKGTIATNDSILFASAMELDIEFFGRSAHVAFPEQGRNAFDAMRLFLDEVNKIPIDINNPIIFGIGKFQSGKVRNIVPDFAKLEGSIRSFEISKSIEYINKLENILKEIEQLTEVSYKIIKGAYYKEVVNSPQLFTEAQNRLSGKMNFEKCDIKMTGEDFGFFAEKYSSLMMWLGTKKDKSYGLHNPKFFPEDSIINDGIEVYKLLIE